MEISLNGLVDSGVVGQVLVLVDVVVVGVPGVLYCESLLSVEVVESFLSLEFLSADAVVMRVHGSCPCFHNLNT